MSEKRLTPLLAGALAVLALGRSLPVGADDTDIYLNPNVPSGAEPLVMFTLDTRSNVLNSSFSCAAGSGCNQLRVDGYLTDAPAGSGTSSKFFRVLRAVMKKVLDPLDGVKIGLMLNHNHENNAQGHPEVSRQSNGAYVALGFREMDAGTDPSDTMLAAEAGEDPNKLALYQKLDDLGAKTESTSLVHPFQGKELYFELFRYLTGQRIYNGHNGFDDYGDNNNTKNLNDPADAHYALRWDDSIETGDEPPPSDTRRYVSPLAVAVACTKMYVINIMFQVSQQDSDSDTAITATKSNGGMGGINLSGSNNKFDTVIRYMRDADIADGSFGTAPNLEGKQNVVSYFLVKDQALNGQTVPGYATNGGTTALGLSDDVDQLVAAFSNIFKSILSVSTTFVAPSVPVNVFNRAQVADQVFTALFQADEDGYPFWPGNLKKLVIGTNALTGVRELQATNGLPAIDIDGRIKREAITFWTNPATLPAPGQDEIAGADGRSVTRGGVGQKIPGFVSGSPGLLNSASGARQLFTEGATGGLIALNADATTANLLWTELTAKWLPPPSATSYSSATTAEQARAINLLRWVRGLAGDVTTDSTTKRNWMIADPLHSRPRPINYGASGGYTTSNQNIRILMGTNDGVLHSFRNTTTTGAQDGSETWGFVPRAALPLLDRLRVNTGGTPVHPIAADGAPTVLVKDTNRDGNIGSGENVLAFFGMRRGGKHYYALDISNPAPPQFLWKISKGSTGFEELGQTWSVPQIGKVDLTDDNNINPLDIIVFAGGYNGDDDGDNVPDLGKDAANRNGGLGTDDDEGNAIYVVNALTGQLIWKASGSAASSGNRLLVPAMRDSIPSNVTVADLTGDGLLDRIYVGDTGGVLWRADLGGFSTSQWTVTPILSVGRHFDATRAADRRFFNAPDVALTRDQNGDFEAVLIGTGDREDPLDNNHLPEENWFYMLKDRTTPVSGRVHTSLADLADCLQLSSCPASSLDLLDQSGWRIRLGAPGSGEKNLAPALTLGGIVFFTTFEPRAALSACDLNEGLGYLYAVHLQDATAVYSFNTSNDGGTTPTLERSDRLESGGIPVEPVATGGDEILIQGQGPDANLMDVKNRTRWKTYWYDREQ